jgi:hypothetical protein
MGHPVVGGRGESVVPTRPQKARTDGAPGSVMVGEKLGLEFGGTKGRFAVGVAVWYRLRVRRACGTALAAEKA